MNQRLRQFLRRMMPVVITLCTLFMSSEAFASHFRHGNITWTIPNPVSAPRTVEFVVTTSWRDNVVSNMRLNFGDGQVFDPSSNDNPRIGGGTDAQGQVYDTHRYVTTHQYAPGQDVFTAFISGCCRIAGLQGGASNRAFRVETIVDLGAGNTGGPVTAGTAIVQMVVGGTRTHFFAATDPDGDPISCRYAVGQPETGYAYNPPIVGGNTASINTVTGGCEVVWDLSGANAGDVGDKHVLHLVVESTRNGVVSKTALDLIVELVATAPPTCSGGGTFTRTVGQPLAVMLTGAQPGGVAGNLEATVTGPMGATLSGTTTGAPPLMNTLNWTPTQAEQNSSQIILVNYRNVATNQTGTCSITVNIPFNCQAGNPCTPPNPGQGACALGTSTCPNGSTQPQVCVQNMPTAETCDGVDNDCNGTTDDGTAIGQMCSVMGGQGICATGVTTCNGGTPGCMGNINPGDQMEVCDGLDNDCDGDTDEAAETVGMSCMTMLPGECAAGTTTCSMGMGDCMATVNPGDKMETCDGVDNDCDGNVDNGFNIGAACTVGQGACAAMGVNQCDGMGGVECSATPGTPSPTELCGDNIDSNCNGDPNDGCSCVTDADCGGANSGSICLVNMGVATCGAGCKGMDMEMDAGCPMGSVCTSMDATPGQCVACLTDNDCGGPDNGQICENQACVAGCRGQMGSACPMGELCTSMDASAGQCVGCLSDSDCGAADSGKVCNDASNTCQDGCRGTGGNACPSNEVCSSTDSTIGTCSPKDTDGDGLSDDEEAAIGTDPNDADSDDDGLLDGEEPSPGEDTDMDGKVNALDDDSDNDGLKDGTEAGKDCTNAATDASKGNCVGDADAGATKTDPLKPDTDEGGVSDGDEDANKNGQVDENERDPNNKADDSNCTADSDCGSPNSGKICEGGMCQDGCRGMGGNGCPSSEICSSMDTTPGTCMPDGAAGSSGSSGAAGSAGTAGGTGNTACNSNEDCTGGQVCDPNTKQCVDPTNAANEEDVIAQGAGLLGSCSVEGGSKGRGNTGTVLALFAAAMGVSLLRRGRRKAA